MQRLHLIGLHIKCCFENSLGAWIWYFLLAFNIEKLLIEAAKNRFLNVFNVFICLFRSAVSCRVTDSSCRHNLSKPCLNTFLGSWLTNISSSKFLLHLCFIFGINKPFCTLSVQPDIHNASFIRGYISENYTHTATIKQLVIVWLHWGKNCEVAWNYKMNTYKTA